MNVDFCILSHFHWSAALFQPHHRAWQYSTVPYDTVWYSTVPDINGLGRETWTLKKRARRQRSPSATFINSLLKWMRMKYFGNSLQRPLCLMTFDRLESVVPLSSKQKIRVLSFLHQKCPRCGRTTRNRILWETNVLLTNDKIYINHAVT